MAEQSQYLSRLSLVRRLYIQVRGLEPCNGMEVSEIPETACSEPADASRTPSIAEYWVIRTRVEYKTRW